MYRLNTIYKHICRGEAIYSIIPQKLHQLRPDVIRTETIRCLNTSRAWFVAIIILDIDRVRTEVPAYGISEFSWFWNQLYSKH